MGLAPHIDVALDAGAPTVELMLAISCDDVLVEWLDTDVAGLRCCFALASSLGTFGPPAREHATLCRTQFEQGDSSLHCAKANTRQPDPPVPEVVIATDETHLDMSPLTLRTTFSRFLVPDSWRSTDVTAIHCQPNWSNS